MTAIAQPSSLDIITWRFVVERRGAHYLYPLCMSSRLPSSIVKARILAVYYRGQPWWSLWFCRPIMGIVTVTRVYRHFIVMSEKNAGLLGAEAVSLSPGMTDCQKYSPSILNPSPVMGKKSVLQVVILRTSIYLDTYRTFAVGLWASLGASGSPKAIILRPKPTHIGLGLVTAAILLAIVAPGVLVGMLTGQVELGITLSAAIAGTFTLAGNLRGQVGYGS